MFQKPWGEGKQMGKGSGSGGSTDGVAEPQRPEGRNVRAVAFNAPIWPAGRQSVRQGTAWWRVSEAEIWHPGPAAKH